MKEKKTLVLILGVALAAALVVGLIFGVKALNAKPNTDPSGTEGSAEPARTGEPDQSGEPAQSGEATEPGTETEPTEEMEETPEMAAARTKEAYTEDDIRYDDPRLDQVVASCAGAELTNRELQVYYCMQFFSFMNEWGAYASMIGLDENQPLRDQPSTVGKLTWEQYFLMVGVQQFQQYSAVADKARSEGYSLTEEEAEQLRNSIAGLEEDAKSVGMTGEEYLQSYFGNTVRMQDYESYLNTYFLAMSYENYVYENVNPSDAELQEYYENHPDNFEGVSMDTRNIDVRHILFLSDPDEDGEATEEEKAAAKAKAEALLEEFRKAPSEEAFAALAKENSEDPGSVENGGLYEDVSPGRMVTEFNDWCFDAARQPGDTDVVETDYGYHVMYFVGQNDNYYWKTIAEQNYAVDYMDEMLDKLFNEVALDIRYEDVVLAPIPIPEAE